MWDFYQKIVRNYVARLSSNNLSRKLKWNDNYNLRLQFKKPSPTNFVKS